MHISDVQLLAVLYEALHRRQPGLQCLCPSPCAETVLFHLCCVQIRVLLLRPDGSP